VLTLEHTALTDSGVKEVSYLKTLGNVNLSNTAVTDDGIGCLVLKQANSPR